MERLTKTYEDGTHGIADNFANEENNALIEKLGVLEDLEEQGKLLRLPCAIEDITYWICDEDEDKTPVIKENNPVIAIAMKKDGFYILTEGSESYDKLGDTYAFLTREEAEAALKSYKGE